MLRQFCLCRCSALVRRNIWQLQNCCVLTRMQACEQDNSPVSKLERIMVRVTCVRINLTKTRHCSRRRFRPRGPSVVVPGRHIEDKLGSGPQAYGGIRITNTSKTSGYGGRKTRCDETIRSNGRP